MAILIAIAIPVFSAQMDKARDAVDESTARSAKSLAEAHFLLEHAEDGNDIECEFTKDGNGNLTISKCSGTGCTLTTAGDIEPSCKVHNAKPLKITVDKTGLVGGGWGKPSP